MARKLFKKASITDTLINVGIGGAANVAVDYVFNMVAGTSKVSGEGDSATPATAEEPMFSDTTKNIIKVVGGAVVGSMISNKLARAAADGVATVGVSNLLSGLMEEDKPTTGLPYGTIGRVPRLRPRYGAKKKVGSLSAGFMSK